MGYSNAEKLGNKANNFIFLSSIRYINFYNPLLSTGPYLDAKFSKTDSACLTPAYEKEGNISVAHKIKHNIMPEFLLQCRPKNVNK